MKAKRPIFLVSSFLILLVWFNMGNDDGLVRVPTPVSAPRDFHYKYTVQKGFFMQSEDETDDGRFDFRKENFGLVSRSYPTDSEEQEQEQQWKRFEKYVRSLEEGKQAGESYKVLFLGRHGEGWHNVAEAKYGTEAWDCYYSALNGASGLTWSDAHLTPLGTQQAHETSTLWSHQLSLGLPPPQKYYASPLTRAIQTADLTFSPLNLKHHLAYKPHIKELLREALGIHTCDRRSTLAHLRTTYPHLTFEKGFEEEDVLWKEDYREPASARRYRLSVLLDEVFAEEEEGEGVVWVSLTSHSGAIASALEGVGHRAFRLETGGVIPVFLKAERVEGKRDVPPWEPSDAPPLCKEPPPPPSSSSSSSSSR
ncbi:phosphoglycerate mutase [Pyrenophora seminiperda CCB06]|uniref:Phosphoglycerate mutase n=1 Tax=Pyrenophora seminiperda CCB06 TaxID=1302712 RepID=A0A3M7MH47_9PLEO|nr:phosphoglycerate mutase [Pyrenophora seminiperda CCB06]